MHDRTLTLPGDDPMAPYLLAAASFLSQYENPNTRRAYASDLRIYFAWCRETLGLDPLAVRRVHVQMFVRHLGDERNYTPPAITRTMTAVRCYYRTAVLDDYLGTSPTLGVRTPRVVDDPTRRVWLNRWELAALIKTARADRASDWAMVELLATIGMRVTAMCNARIEDLQTTPEGYRVLRSVGKGGVASLKALPIPVARAVDAATAGRTEGPIVTRRDGSAMTRRSAGHRICLLGTKAGIDRHVTPHSLRRAHVTLSLKAGVPLHVVQMGVDHADPRTTLRYNALGVELHGQASHTLAAMIASS